MSQTLSFLLPRAPKLDKMAALYVWVVYAKQTLFSKVSVLFHEAGKAYPPEVIDVDALEDYKVQGYKSATASVVLRHPELLNIRGMRYFMQLFDYNNSTGDLKNRYEDNFFNLVNDWPRAPHSRSREAHLMLAITAMWRVFTTYFAVANIVGDEGITDCRNPFCQQGLLRMLTLLDRYPGYRETAEDGGEAYIEIEAMFDREAGADERTNETAHRIKPELEFTLVSADGKEIPAAVYRTDDQRVCRRIWSLRPDLGMQIIRKRSGHYAIQVRGQQALGLLHEALDQAEPGLWYLETRYRSPFILNGGESRDVAPSGLTPTQISKQVREHFRYASQSNKTTEGSPLSC